MCVRNRELARAVLVGCIGEGIRFRREMLKAHHRYKAHRAEEQKSADVACNSGIFDDDR